MSIEFVEPPPDRFGRVRQNWITPEVLAAVREHPGEWAKPWSAVDKSAQAAVRSFCYRRPEWEMTARTVVTGPPVQYDVYLRYVGDQHE